MTDVYDRVQAVVDTAKDFLLDRPTPPADSLFGRDAALVSFQTYDIVCQRWVTGVSNLRVAADMSKSLDISRLGTHLVALRSAMLATARGLWITSSFEPAERVARAAGVVIADRRMGYKAMRAASEATADPGFSVIAERFFQAQQKVKEDLQRANISPIGPPADTSLVRGLGDAVDDYYGGTGESRRDAVIFWNASSGLSHGERWFPDLGRPLQEIVTDRSLDVVCSGLNLLWLSGVSGISTGLRLPFFPEVGQDPSSPD